MSKIPKLYEATFKWCTVLGSIVEKPAYPNRTHPNMLIFLHEFFYSMQMKQMICKEIPTALFIAYRSWVLISCEISYFTYTCCQGQFEHLDIWAGVSEGAGHHQIFSVIC